MLKKEKGFTLIEILIVIVVIGILAAIAIPAVRGMRDQAKMSEVEGDFKTIKTAIEAYFLRYDAYPDTPNSQPENPASGSSWQTNLLNASPRILDQALADPFGAVKGDSYYYYEDSEADNQNWVVISVGPDQTLNSSDYQPLKSDTTVTKVGDDIVVSNLNVVE